MAMAQKSPVSRKYPPCVLSYRGTTYIFGDPRAGARKYGETNIGFWGGA
jgi:hypothetical protein